MGTQIRISKRAEEALGVLLILRTSSFCVGIQDTRRFCHYEAQGDLI